MADGNAPKPSAERWYTASELAGLPGVPGTERRVRSRAEAEGWQSRPRCDRGGGREYAFTSLPTATQAALLLRDRPSSAVQTVATRAHGATRRVAATEVASAWERFEAAAATLRAEAERRVLALVAVLALIAQGTPVLRAREIVAAQMVAEGIKGASAASLARWQVHVGDAPRSDWAALLLPAYTGRTATADCSPEAWDWYAGHYLTRQAPSFESTYRRLEKVAAANGWTIPSAKTMQRRLESTLSRITIVLRREGVEAAARLVPTLQRDALGFAAGEAVNGDGLKFDRLWVRFADGEVINTATAWFWQCVRTRKILAWRLAKTENTDVFRLATYDLTGVCAPRYVFIDNTRVAANKVMTAGAAGRHRFKTDPDDGLGLLLMLDMEPHFTNPDKELGNPGAKPIERAFGIGGIHSEVASHPSFIARGYSTATAVGDEELRTVIAEEVARFNARLKRRTQACRGVLSFDQAWEEAVTQQAPRVLSERQRRLLLMSREVVTADKRSGMVTLAAGRGPNGANRYWCEALAELAGRKVAVHFDPDNLAADVHVYSLTGEYLVTAQRMASAAFNDTTAAREHAKFKDRLVKARKKASDAETRMSDLERAALYDATKPDADEPSAPVAAGNVIAPVFSRLPDPARDAELKRTGTDDLPSVTAMDTFLKRHQQAQIDRIGWTPPGDDS